MRGGCSILAWCVMWRLYPSGVVRGGSIFLALCVVALFFWRCAWWLYLFGVVRGGSILLALCVVALSFWRCTCGCIFLMLSTGIPGKCVDVCVRGEGGGGGR